MDLQKQQHIKQEGYAQAMRYMDNATDILKKAGRDGKFFEDPKYVSSASGIAYKGVLVALDYWLQSKGVNVPESAVGKKERKSIDFYRGHLAKLDKKLLKYLNGVYSALHLNGYYDATLVSGIVDVGFEMAKEIVEKIKPTEAL